LADVSRDGQGCAKIAPSEGDDLLAWPTNVLRDRCFSPLALLTAQSHANSV
jgi:hypothetical protein